MKLADKTDVCKFVQGYKVHIFIAIMPFSLPNPMFDHLLESSHRDDSNKWSNKGFGKEITQALSVEIYFKHCYLFLAQK